MCIQSISEIKMWASIYTKTNNTGGCGFVCFGREDHIMLAYLITLYQFGPNLILNLQAILEKYKHVYIQIQDKCEYTNQSNIFDIN